MGRMASLPTRSLSQHLRHSIHPSQSGSQSPALIARIEEKKAELENLKELRDLSAAMAGHMEALQQKLATLSDGTEGATKHIELHCGGNLCPSVPRVCVWTDVIEF